MSLGLLALALALAGYAVLSRRLSASVLTAPIVFLSVGIVSELIGITNRDQDEGALRFAAEATLTVVLFSDAARIDVARLRKGWRIPARLLTIGLILTVLLGTLVAVQLFPELLLAEALILAVCLAPTDAALGMSVVTDTRIPARIRQALNVESGLNDGICVPLLFIAIATAQAEGGAVTGAEAIRTVVEELGFGIVGGLLAGSLGAFLLRLGVRNRTLDEAWGPVLVVATAIGAYGLAAPLGGSGFIAAFVAGAIFGFLVRRPGMDPSAAPADIHEEMRFLEGLGVLLTAATFVLFGGIVADSLPAIRAEYVVYAVLSLTVIRILPVAISMLRSRARPQTVAFLGWFGPRGLASIVFAVIVLEDAASLPGVDTIVGTIAVTVVLSVLAHGLTAWPLAGWYSAWFDRASRSDADLMEGAPVPHVPARGGALGPASHS